MDNFYPLSVDEIIYILKKAASIKDQIVPLCDPNMRHYKGRKIGYIKCFRCYPNQPERSKREDSRYELNCGCRYVPKIEFGYCSTCTDPIHKDFSL